MKLEVTHKEIVAGLTQFLASQGISGFDPATCQVTFTQKRGTGELSAVLDTDPAPSAPVEPKPATKPEVKAELPKEEPKADPAPETPVAETQADIDTQSGVEPETASADAGDDNLFD